MKIFFGNRVGFFLMTVLLVCGIAGLIWLPDFMGIIDTASKRFLYGGVTSIAAGLLCMRNRRSSIDYFPGFFLVMFGACFVLPVVIVEFL